MRTQLRVGLTDVEESALAMIAGAAQAWCPVKKLARAGHSTETLEALRATGWVESWDLDKRGKPLSYPSWSLTPWAARKLGRYIIEARGCPVWSSSPVDRREFARARLAPRERRLSFPELVPDKKRSGTGSAQFIASRYWNETTDDPDRAERILGAPIRLVEAF
jgi:hypothetical protein